MNSTVVSYELSEEADKDLENIFDFTVENFSLEQAVVYLNGFEDVFVLLISNTHLGKKREEIRPELRSIVKESHVIFYRIKTSTIRIVRVLHSSQDVKEITFPENI